MYNIISPDERIIKSIALCGDSNVQLDSKYSLQDFFCRVANLGISRADFYKQSVYNYVEKSEKRCLIYNTLYHSLVSLTPEEYQCYLGQIGCNDDDETFFVENGLWVSEQLDERMSYRKLSEAKHLHSSQEVVVVIAVTQACNARCAYCYERGIAPKTFPFNRVDELVSFIEQLDYKHAVQITWFGGEPLLNVKFIDAVTQKLTEKDIPFSSSMISNGSLITENMIEKNFPLWKLKLIQVTLDGTAKEYERIKAYKDGRTGHFEQLLTNIANVAEHKVRIDVRLNIDKNNTEDIIKLCQQLEERFGDNEYVKYYPSFINGSDADVPEEERTTFLYALLRQMKDPAKTMGVRRMYALPLSSPCHRCVPTAFSVDAEGNLYKCEHDVGYSERKLGTISEGLMEEDARYQPPKLRESCQDCVFLPRCYGGCESNYIQGAIPCMIDKYSIPAYMRVILDK